MSRQSVRIRNGAVVVLLAVVSITLLCTEPGTAASPVMAQASRSATSIEVKLRDDAQAELDGSTLVSRSGRDLSQLDQKLSSPEVVHAAPLLGDLAAGARAQFETNGRRNGSARDGASYFRIEVRSKGDVDRVVQELRSLPYVEDAYPTPVAVPAPAAPSFVSQQSQLAAAPDGLGLTAASVLKGGKGTGVRVADVEYSWNVDHEDLAAARVTGATIAVGTPGDPFSDTNHGTAVLGILAAKRNTFGVTGEAYGSKLFMANAYSAESGWNLPQAITAAMTRLKAGDVLLLEQQAAGPNGEYVPVEWVPSVYDAIAAASAAGVIVIEPAGNGGANLDSGAYGVPFPSGKADSGAIMVGAGSACAGSPKRQRMYFSDFGARVNVQGPGECVVSTGYGDLYNGGPLAQYTAWFSGTSSASATIAGGAEVLSAGYRAAVGTVASPGLIRSLLVAHSTPQDLGVAGAIGPMPDVYRALLSIDTRAPTAPTNLTVALNSAGKPVVKWKAATDNQGVQSYRVFRNGSLLTTIKKSSSFTDKTAAAATSDTYYLRAVDYAGHVSAASMTVSITTA